MARDRALPMLRKEMRLHEGATYVDMEVCNPDTGKCIIRKFLVDTGSMYTWITYDDAVELGLYQKGLIPLTLADQKIILRGWSIADLKVEGRKAVKRPIVIGETRLLSFQDLEILNLKVNPPKRKLSKICI